METILATAFGRIVNIQQGESDELTKAAHGRFRQLEEGRSTSRETVMILTSKWTLCRHYHKPLIHKYLSHSR